MRKTGKYLDCNVTEFWKILQEEMVNGEARTWHHVFNGNLKKGAWQKKQLGKNGLMVEYKKYGLNMDEIVCLAAAIHCVLNKLLGSCTPPVIFANLNCIFDSIGLDRRTKVLFTKFVLYIVCQKFKRRMISRELRNSGDIDKFVNNIYQKCDIIDTDVNDGNKNDAESIMLLFQVTRDELIHFLTKNFLPYEWTKYPKELWDLSL